MWQSSWQTTSSSTQAGASSSRHENESVPLVEHEPQRVRWSRTAKSSADAERRRLALDRGAQGLSRRRAVPALERGRGALVVGRAQLERARAPIGADALGAHDAQRDRLAAVPGDAGAGQPERRRLLARERLLEPGRELLERIVDRARRSACGTTSSGPAPWRRTRRRLRALAERRMRTLTSPLRRSTVRSIVHGRHTTCRAGGADHGAIAVHGEGPCWLARSGELAWVDMIAGRVLATSLANGHDAGHRDPRPDRGDHPPARRRRPRRRDRDGRRPARRVRVADARCARSSTSPACA